MTAILMKVNQGRWVADCPACGGAERIWPDGLRTHPEVPHPFGIFDSTLHCGYTGATYDVAFPSEAAEIMAVLARRPNELNRNWEPGETVMDLRLENLNHGVI